MRIAFIPSTFLPHIGGAEIQAHNVANKLVEKGNDVEVFVLDKVKIKNAKYKIIPFKKKLINLVYLFRYYLNINLNFVLKIYFEKIIKENKINAWHFQSVNFKTLIYIEVLRSLNQKIVVTLQGADIQINREIGYGYRLDNKYDQLIQKVFQKVDIFHAISNDIKNELISFGIDKKKIFKITNFSIQEKFDSIPKNNNKILTLLTVGRFAIKKKGFDLIEKVAKELDKIIDYKWIIIGRGTKKLLEEDYFLKNQNKFEILNEINNDDETYFPSSKLIEYYKKSHLYVNLARVEGSPLVVLDAISSNLPIISFNTPGGDELVLDNINGHIIDGFDFQLFASKIIEFSKFKIDVKKDEIVALKDKFNLEKNIAIIESHYK